MQNYSEQVKDYDPQQQSGLIRTLPRQTNFGDRILIDIGTDQQLSVTAMNSIKNLQRALAVDRERANRHTREAEQESRLEYCQPSGPG